MLQIGSVIDNKYKIIEVLGHGGMSVVYLAKNEKANKLWAIKEVRRDKKCDEKIVNQGLIVEFNILKELRNKYLPSIVDVIEDKDKFLIVMDYIQGENLNKILIDKMQAENRPLNVENVLLYGIQLCEVLSYLHSNNILYLDMKPSNIMRREDGEQIYLIDFGTAKRYKGKNLNDMLLGTKAYAPPELKADYVGEGKPCPQSDIYSLGATLFCLITGKITQNVQDELPYITVARPQLLEETPWELRNKVLGLELIIAKCTKWNINERYQTCKDVKKDLEHPERLTLQYRKKRARKLAIFGTCLSIGVLFGGLSLFGIFMANKTEKTGYDYYIEKASIASYDEKLSNYRKAIALNPENEIAWMGVLDTVEEDNAFTTDEDSFIIAMLSENNNGTGKDNKSCFQKNISGYVQFSYRLGLMYYYNLGDGNNKASAVKWFENVTNQDSKELELGLDPKKVQGMKTRAEILGKISTYSRKIGQVNQAGDAEISYKDYWNDLIKLTEQDIAEKDNVITELRLYNEVVYQICTNYDKFKEDGLSKEEMGQALNKIKEMISSVSVEETSPLAEQIRQTILKNIEVAEKQIEAIFSKHSIIAQQAKEGEY